MKDYAARLSDCADKGVLGAEELHDTAALFQQQHLPWLVERFQSTNRIVVLTGAGISTAAGIRDFRGPNGIWTQASSSAASKTATKLEPNTNTTTSTSTSSSLTAAPTVSTSNLFELACPTFTHMALSKLCRAGRIQHVTTQNVDGLHQRSGLPDTCLSELHGNVFKERCRRCGEQFLRDVDVGGMSFRLTGRRCEVCDGPLEDDVLDWNDPLPEEQFQLADANAKTCKLYLCLGTSLQIAPCCNIPSKAVRAGAELAIVNFQRTPRDKQASCLVHRPVDEVMAQLLKRLHVSIDAPYTRHIYLAVRVETSYSGSGSGKQEGVTVHVVITSADNPLLAIPPHVLAVDCQLQVDGKPVGSRSERCMVPHATSSHRIQLDGDAVHRLLAVEVCRVRYDEETGAATIAEETVDGQQCRPKRPLSEEQDQKQEPEPVDSWVQCDRCLKWRLFSGDIRQLPDSWDCSLHPSGQLAQDCNKTVRKLSSKRHKAA